MSSQISIPLVTKGYYDLLYFEVLAGSGYQHDPQDISPQPFVAFCPKKMGFDPLVQPIDLSVNDVSRHDHGWRADPVPKLFKLPDQLRQQYLGNIPTTFLASDYLGNYEEAKKVIDAYYQAD